jgi:hypothetical protein
MPRNTLDLAAMQTDIRQCPVIKLTEADNRSPDIPFWIEHPG